METDFMDCVATHTKFTLLWGDRPRLQVALRYSRQNPHVVEMTFIRDRQTWFIYRDSLDRGQREPVGLHELKVWPFDGPNGKYTGLALGSGDAICSLRMRRSTVSKFLVATYMIVPEGEEGKWLDINGTIQRLLSQ